MEYDPFQVTSRRAESVVVTGVFWGLAFGFIEVVILGIQRHLLGSFIWTPGPIAWMTPLGYVIIFGSAACVLALLALLPTSWFPARIPAFVFLLMGLVGLTSMLQRVHPVALVVLSAGAAAALVRYLERRSAGYRRLIRRGTVWLVLGWVVVFGTDFLVRYAGRARAEASLPAPRPGAPNIVLVILDTARARNFSLYGYERETTPFLERFASRGVLFERAIATSPWSLPSHASLFTGRDAHALPANWLTPMGPSTTLAAILRQHGYYTAGFTANFFYTGRETGLADGFIVYRDYVPSPLHFLLSSALGQAIHRWAGAIASAEGIFGAVRQLGQVHPIPRRWSDRRFGSDIETEFARWRRHQPRRPYFVFINFLDAHLPYYSPPAVQADFASGRPLWDLYDASLAYLDATLETLVRRLEVEGELERTIVVITSDHGELLGEYGLLQHGQALYLPLLHVPLVIVGPGVPAGISVSQPVSLRHVARTVLQLAGIEATSFPGRSLSPLWSGGATHDIGSILAEVREGINTPPDYPVTRGDMASITTDRHHLIRNGDARLELFDLLTDAGKTIALARELEPDSLVRALRSALHAGRRP